MDIAVYTYYDTPSLKSLAGFSFKRDLQDFVTLSVRESNKHIGRTKLVATSYGAEILKGCGFTEIDTSLDNAMIHKAMWAYAKIYAYSIQKEPFMHIDLDAALHRPLTAEEKTADFVFQQKEPFSNHKRYKNVIMRYKQFNPNPVIDLTLDYGVCCGFMGCNDLETIQVYKTVVDRFIRQTDFARTGYWFINHFFEQYFIAVLTINKNIKFVGDTGGFTHLWNKKKQNQEKMAEIRQQLAVA